MAMLSKSSSRVTTLDDIFEYLHDEIANLRLAPGDKISEAEIAAKFGVSRQPVRDAFRRLENLELLLIRPQRATVVKRFSIREIKKSRFVRQAVEKEVLLRAAQYCDDEGAARLEAEIKAQTKLVEDKNYDAFGDLDYAFHKTICQIAKADYAFDVITQEKSKVDRLCLLSLSKEDRLPDLVADHKRIADAVIANDERTAIAEGTFHLSRLNDTIAHIYEKNANYFDA